MLEKIKIERSAHYFLQLPSKEINSVLFVIHGYAQQADEFLSEFEYLKNTQTLVVAPEGLSLFYNKKREAVASWMTSRHREDEMNDYIHYLNALYEKIKREYDFDKTAVLGFSQGVSTSLRWVCKMPENTVEYFACSGSIPPELKANDFRNQNIKAQYFYGDEDRLISTQNAEEQFLRLKELTIEAHDHPYSGGHEVPLSCHQLIRRWASVD
ncbi:MAG: hypothetical protein RIC95_07950 [Vicingaceae bacterium]